MEGAAEGGMEMAVLPPAFSRAVDPQPGWIYSLGVCPSSISYGCFFEQPEPLPCGLARGCFTSVRLPCARFLATLKRNSTTERRATMEDCVAMPSDRPDCPWPTAVREEPSTSSTGSAQG